MAGDGFTIGEVLNLLKDDFEEITISKIRFLESEGLVYPDRTESGYRKFTDDDIDRLRFILTAQRDHYLPLKVIREQLERVDRDEGGRLSNAAAGSGGAGAGGAAIEGPVLDGRRGAELAQALESAAGAGAGPLLEVAPTPVALSLRDFCEATGLTAAQVRALRDFGIVGDGQRDRTDDATFDSDDLLAARAARELLRLGLEPRHLRMYRQFVDRELALFEQLVTPLLRQRNPEARRQATRQLEQLASSTGRMKRALLAQTLRGYIHGG